MKIKDLVVVSNPILQEDVYYPSNLSILSTQLKFTVFAAYGTVHKNMKYIVMTLPMGSARIRLGSAKTEIIDSIYDNIPWPESTMTADDGTIFRYKTAPSPQALNSYLDKVAEEYADII